MLKGKKALVTGSSRGIGRKIVETFLANGAEVWGLCSKPSAAKPELEAFAKENGTVFHEICANVGDSQVLSEVVKAALAEAGNFDVLVNNAGISHINLLSDMTDEDWNHIIQTNLSSVFYCCRQAIPPMVSKRSGKIINISSMWGLSGASCEVAYSASKSGINGFTKALAKELAPSNVQVNAIACGVIDTSMNDQLTPEERKALEDEIPAGRYGTPKEIAQMVWNIVHAPEYMTGQIIGVDGGFL